MVRTRDTICQVQGEMKRQDLLFQKHIAFQHKDQRCRGASELRALCAQVTTQEDGLEGTNSVSCIVLTVASIMGLFGKC